MMRVRLLGTGSADGWPNAFCDCASCLAAHRAGQWRGPTSALVDDRILLDCGPETPRAALRHGTGLQRVTHVLITHNHPDHSAPMALLARSWAGRTEPLTVVGTESVIASWCLWVGPDEPIRWRVVLPGDVLDAGGYTVRVLAAAHGDEQAVVYDFEGQTAKEFAKAKEG
jgi:adenosylcobinamide kinase/adenosylcobinamide-phosphate guanylyltransferase